jgi:hypothetical protein
MSEMESAKIAWRRGERGPTYIGAVSRTTDTIRLRGRDPILGIDVALSIPIEEIDEVVVEGVAGSVDGSAFVVLDLPGSEPIHLWPVGGSSLDVHLLARAMGLDPPSAMLSQGGRR